MVWDANPAILLHIRCRTQKEGPIA
jgi:hypothetical protein